VTSQGEHHENHHFRPPVRCRRALIVSAALGFAAEAQARPVMQIDAYNTCMKSLKPREGTTAASFDCRVVAGARGPGESIPKAGAY